jgi:uncharacterized protein (DUF427 family)
MNKHTPAIENVWDYPRPPRLEPAGRRIRVLGGTHTIADSSRALRVLETSHPPVYYVPPEQVDLCLLRQTATRSFCEFKGRATYWTLEICQPGQMVQIPDVAWSYETPSRGYEAIAGHIAFYASRLAAHGFECWVDDEQVVPQTGDFYGGWITKNLRGPFKGAAGTGHW